MSKRKGNIGEEGVLFAPDPISEALLNFATLTGGRGGARVPRDPQEREVYFRVIRLALSDRFGLSDAELASLQNVYRAPDGPCKVRRELSRRQAAVTM